MLHYHRIGTPQCEFPTIAWVIWPHPCHMAAEDVLVHSDKENPTWMWSTDISEDGNYLFLYTLRDTSRVSLLYFVAIFVDPCPAEKSSVGCGSGEKWYRSQYSMEQSYRWICRWVLRVSWNSLFLRVLFAHSNNFLCRVTNDGPLLYINTNLDAPKDRLATIDLNDTEKRIKDLIPEDKDASLISVSCINKSNFVVVYKRNVSQPTVTPLFSVITNIRPGHRWNLYLLQGGEAACSFSSRFRGGCFCDRPREGLTLLRNDE